MYQVRRSLVYWARDNKGRIELLAFMLMLKQYSDTHSTIKDFSINKIAVMTHSSWATCKKYVRALLDSKLATYDKERNTLSIGRVSSGTKHRNMRIDGLDFRTIKAAKDSVRHLIHMLGIIVKRFVKEVTRAATNPKTWPSTGYKDDKLKAAALCKKFVRPNPDTMTYEFRELGKSYNTIAKQMGCCKKTAIRIIRDGVREHLYRKKVMPLTWFRLSKSAMRTCADMFTFVTRKGFAAMAEANRYSLSKEWGEKLFQDERRKVQTPLTEDEYNEYMAIRKEKEEKFKKLYRKKLLEVADYLMIDEDEAYRMRLSWSDIREILQTARAEACFL